MKRIVWLLNQPYPLENKPALHLRNAALIGLFVGMFLLIFQPFNIHEWQTPDKSLKVLGFGVVCFVTTVFNFLVWPRLFPRIFREENWTVGRAILSIITNILLIAIANWLYLAWLLDTDAQNLLSMVIGTFLVGIFPTTGVVITSYMVKLRQYARQAAELPLQLTVKTDAVAPDESDTVTKNESAQSLTLVADNEKDRITLAPADLLYIESSDNYCTVAHLKNGEPTKPLLRSSLSRLETQINQPHVVRCHRSYVVNLDRVERVTGNAQGYKLHLLGGEFQIPVARKYNDTLVAKLRNT